MSVNHITVDLTRAQYRVLVDALDKAKAAEPEGTRAALVRANARAVLDTAAKAHRWI